MAGGNGFESEVGRRQEAMRLIDDEGISVADAARRVGRSRWWVHHWRNRYVTGGDEALVDRSRAPKTHPTKTPGDVVAKVLEVRERLEGNPVASIGALTIISELEREGFTSIPSIATIERILHRAGKTRPHTKQQRTGSKLPLPAVTTPGVWQQADWVQDRYLEGGIRFNSLQISDVGSHGVVAGQYVHRTMVNAVTLLLEEAWPYLSIPQAMSIDNAFSKTTHPNNPFTNWVKACLLFGVEVVVSPPGTTGWNNHAENVNNQWQNKTIRATRFATLNALRGGSDKAVAWLNTRRPVLDPTIYGTRFADDYINQHRHQLRWPAPIAINDHLDTKGALHLPLTDGRITFLRHVTEQRTIQVALTNWPIPDNVPTGGLVTATITTGNRNLEIRHRGEPITHFAYPIKQPVTDPNYPSADHSLFHHV